MQKYLADILSVLALTMSAEGERVSLLFSKLISYNHWVAVSIVWCTFIQRPLTPYPNSVNLTGVCYIDSVRKALNTDYWAQQVILVRGAMSMLGEDFFSLDIVFMVEDGLLL